MKQTRSQQLYEHAIQLFPGGVNSPVRAFRSVGREPFFVDRGEGAYLYDVDDNRYLDFVASWGPLVLGHAHPAVCEAIHEQTLRGTSYGACCEQEQKLATCIQAFMPSLEMLRFVNSGTEAGLSVVRLARGFTGRSKILKFAGCYHGHVDSLLTQAGSGVATFGLPDCAGVPDSLVRDTVTAPYNDLEAVESLFQKLGDEIAAVILEPVAGNAGLLIPDASFLTGLRKLCDKHGSLLIFDEVMCGFRVSPQGAQGLFDVTPDLSMLGKVIGGGLPVGAFGGREDIMKHLAPEGPVYQAGTLSGNPLAMVAGLATLELWTEEASFGAVEERTRRFAEGISRAAEEAGVPLYAHSLGSMFGFFFQEGPVRNYEDAKRSNTEQFSSFFGKALEAGLYFAPSAFEAGFMSAVHTDEMIDATLSTLTDIFRTLR